MPRARFEEVFDALVGAGLASAADMKSYAEKVTATNRQTYNLCPGLTLRWRKRLDDAAVLDQRGQLEGEVRAATERAASALKLKLPWLA